MKDKVRLEFIFVLLSFLFVISPFYAATAAEDETINKIPDDAVVFNGHSYKIFLEDHEWPEAKAICESMGGHLATITSDKEQAFIDQLNSSDEWLWIGGWRDAGYTWYWVTQEKWSYTHWAPGEPNDSGIIPNENCAAVWPHEWNDLNETNTIETSGFICEWDSAITKNPSVKTGNSKDVTDHSVTLSLTIKDSAGKKFSDVGIEWRYGVNKATKVSCGKPKKQTGIWEVNLKKLKPGKKVIYRAYAQSGAEVFYGEWKSVSILKQEQFYNSLTEVTESDLKIFSSAVDKGRADWEHNKAIQLTKVKGKVYFKFETGNRVIYILRDAFGKKTSGYNKKQMDSCRSGVSKAVSAKDNSDKYHVLVFSSVPAFLKSFVWNITTLEVSGMYDSTGYTFKVKKLKDYCFTYDGDDTDHIDPFTKEPVFAGRLRKIGNFSFKIIPTITASITKVGKDCSSFSTCKIQGKGNVKKEVDATTLMKIGLTGAKLVKDLNPTKPSILGVFSSLHTLSNDIETIVKGEKITYVGEKHSLSFNPTDKDGNKKKQAAVKAEFKSPFRIEDNEDYFQASIGLTDPILKSPYPTISFTLSLDIQ